MNNVSINISASVVAWYGALVGTVSVIIILFGYLRDRSRLVLTKIRESITLNQGGSKEDNVYYSFFVVNKGRRPISIESVGFLLENEKEIVAPIPIGFSLPHELSEGKSKQILLNKNGVDETVRKDVTNIEYYFVKTATKKIIKKKFRFPFYPSKFSQIRESITSLKDR